MMPPRPIIVFVRIALGLTLAATAALAQGQVYKCKDDAGKTIYSDTQCQRGSKPTKIQNDPPAVGTGSSMCAQLQDELHRLSAANERAGTTPSKRTQSLTRTYESRCVGIARADPTPKAKQAQ